MTATAASAKSMMGGGAPVERSTTLPDASTAENAGAQPVQRRDFAHTIADGLDRIYATVSGVFARRTEAGQVEGTTDDNRLGLVKRIGLYSIVGFNAAHFIGEDMVLAKVAGTVAPHGFFGGTVSSVLTAAFSAGVIAEGYLVSRLANKLPPAVQEAQSRLEEGESLSRAEKVGAFVIKATNAIRAPLVWIAQRAGKASEKLANETNPVKRAIGRVLLTTALVNAEGTPGATTVERAMTDRSGRPIYPAETGGVPARRSLMLATAFAASWVALQHGVDAANEWGGRETHRVLHTISDTLGSWPALSAIFALTVLPLTVANMVAVKKLDADTPAESAPDLVAAPTPI